MGRTEYKSTKKFSFCLLVRFLILIMLPIQIYAQETLQQKNYQQVAIVIASKKGIGRSSFGHAYLRFSTDPQRWTDQDLMIEFVANVEREKVKIRKAIGLTLSPYKYQTIEQSYHTVRKEITILEDRDLTTYPLNINQTKVLDLYQLIINNKEKTAVRNYRFATSNCATEIEEFLDLIIQPRFQVKFFSKPFALIDRYQNYIKKEQIINDLSATHLREKLTNEVLQEIKIERNDLQGQIIWQMLTSKYYFERLFGFVYLSQVTLMNDENQKLKVFIFQNRFTLLESKSLQNDLLEYAKLSLKKQNNEFVEIVPLFQSEFDYPMENRNVDRTNIKFDLQKQIFEIQLLDQLDFSDEQLTTIEIKNVRPDLKVHNYQIQLSNESIATFLKNKLSKNEYLQRNFQTNIARVAVNNNEYLLPFIVVEKKSYRFSLKQINKPTFQGKDLIPLTNFTLNRSFGNCLSLVLTQKKILENIIFRPNLNQLSVHDNQILFTELMNNQMIIVPGFQDGFTWLSSLPQDWLKSKIDELSYQLNIKGYTTLMKKYFTNVTIDRNNISDINHLLSLGITVPILFKVEGKKMGHSLLIYESTQIGNDYYFKVYDPNFGLIDGTKPTTEIRFNTLNEKMYMSLYAKNGVSIEVDYEDKISESMQKIQFQNYKYLEEWTNKQQSSRKWSFPLRELPK